MYQPIKAIAAIRFFADHGASELTKGKVNKLLFLADKLHLVRFGRPITGDWYAAMAHGPVPSATDNMLDALEDNAPYPGVDFLRGQVALDRRFQYPRLAPTGADFNVADYLSESDMETLQEIMRLYGDRSFTDLRRLTHDMPAYEKAWQSRTCNMAEMNFADFFEEDDQALAGVKEEVLENLKLAAAFPEPVWE